MLLVHTLFTVPALLYLFWPLFPVRAEGGPFRILPAVARGVGALVARSPGRVLAAGVGLLLVAVCRDSVDAGRQEARERSPSTTTPRSWASGCSSSRFGLEGAPLVLLVEGDEQDVLTRTAALQAELDPLRRAGQLRAVLAPTSLVPSPAQQRIRGEALRSLDLDGAATALERAIAENGLDPSAFDASVARLREWGAGDAYPGDGRERAPGAAARPAGHQHPPAGPRSVHRGRHPLLRQPRRHGQPAGGHAATGCARRPVRSWPSPTTSVAVDLHDADRPRQPEGVAWRPRSCVVLIVAVLFRSLRVGLLVLLPVAYGGLVTVGVLTAGRPPFRRNGVRRVPADRRPRHRQRHPPRAQTSRDARTRT